MLVRLYSPIDHSCFVVAVCFVVVVFVVVVVVVVLTFCASTYCTCVMNRVARWCDSPTARPAGAGDRRFLSHPVPQKNRVGTFPSIPRAGTWPLAL